jgi:serine/threonine-protein phosphatase PGAM5
VRSGSIVAQTAAIATAGAQIRGLMLIARGRYHTCYTRGPMRRLLFVRHGQYDEDGGGSLTPLGRRQAKKTAHALRRLAVDVVWSSTLPRAKETAAIVVARQTGARLRASDLLCEVIPTKLPKNVALRVRIDAARVRADKARADEAFAMLFKKTRVDRTEIVVCHGNIIRYFVCLALGIERRLWMRLDSMHCGVTELVVLTDGTVRVVRYNDVGHIPLKLRTDSKPRPKDK